MNFRDKLKLSLQTRFGLAILLSIAAFVIVALISVGSFIQVRSEIRHLIVTQLEQNNDSSRLARELLQFVARLKLLETNFYGNEEYLQQEGALLLKMSQHQEHLHANTRMLETLSPLGKELEDYLDHCYKINELLHWLRLEESALEEVFTIVEEEIAKQLGINDDGHGQLQFLIVSSRLSLMEIIQLNERKQSREYFAASFFEPPPGTAQLVRLQQKLKTLNDAPPPVDGFGRQLVDQLEYYRKLTTRFQQEMIHLGRKSSDLGALSDAVLLQMDELSWEHEILAVQTEEEVDSTILAIGAMVLMMLLVLAFLLGFIQLNLFSQHIKKPMEKIRRRLQDFQHGDYSSPMVLQRSDEWGQIETVFNNMLTDLTESWTAVQESERRYRDIFDSASVGIFQSKIDGTLLKVNPTLAIMFGIDPFEDLSQYDNIGQMVYADRKDRERLMKRLLQEEVVSNFEVKLRRKTGESFWASISGHVVLDSEERVQMIEGTVDDISLRRRAEDELRHLKEYLHDIIDTMPSILIGVDESLNVTLWNRQVSEASGVTAEQAQGRSLIEIFSLLDNTQYQQSVSDTIQSQKVHRLTKLAGTNAGDGHFFDLLVYPLRSTDTVGAVIHMDDVTDKAQIEEVMVQSEKMLSVGSLAAGMAHEINNPLASVLQNVQVLDQRLSPTLKKNQQVAEQLGISIEQVADYARLRGFDQMIRSIADAGQRAARIIENMLNFSRKSSSSFLPCSLVELVEKTIELAASDYDMKHHFDFRTISLVREFQSLPDVPCESSQIQQVVLNLLKNSAQALGGQAEKQIVIKLFEKDNLACLQIEDNGAGMDEETRRRIFEPFYTTKDVGYGTGLGLSVSYFLINDNHKGSLTVSSEPGQGTCFTLQLPLER